MLESLDDEKVKVDLNILERTLGFVVINEIKRKVNSTVAEKIYTKLGDLALLRRQMQPIATKMASFRKKIQNFGYNFDVNTADELIKAVLKIKDEDVRVGIEILLFKTMPRAR